MRKWITFLMTFLASVTYADAYSLKDGEVSFEAGYRHDSLNWSAKVPSENPLFRSSTKFKDLDIFQIGINARGNVGCNLYLRGAVDWGWILDGNLEERFQVFDNTVAPIPGNNIASTERTLTTESTNIVDGRYVFDISAAVGYEFHLCNYTMSLSPVVGYSFSEQNLWAETNDNFNIVPAGGTFNITRNSECCRDKLISRWYGPFIGLDWEYNPCGECWNLFAQLEYHWAHQQTKRNDMTGFSGFDSFKSTSRNAHGWLFTVGFDYGMCSCWTVGLSVKAQDWRSSRSHRHDLSGFAGDVSSGNGRLHSETNWNSYAINLRVGRDF